MASSSAADDKKAETADVDQVGLVEVDGAIGNYKNHGFQPLTNFGISCKGFVSSGNSVEGYLVEFDPLLDASRNVVAAVDTAKNSWTWHLDST
ncbi:hypothetical protein OS493_012369 [Desmophyllum pertusum]|uniref:Uncharacterized protein n=1 Tax=Desmophyllum pertusum TaxID=174260 RepID=A0A9X0D4A6_9CNID|nr:hypothetical protein OS493_012369 [Desmophyllum pertusum]